jgi:UDP-3-O-[3-hydroxymyristoyl] N-acetylglucosamine deacetylase
MPVSRYSVLNAFRDAHAHRGNRESGDMANTRQTTIRNPVSLSGIGVHSGKPANLTLHPANADTGVVFLRTNLEGGRSRRIRATHASVSATELCTVIGDQDGGSVSTVEHLMAALYAYGIDNVLVEIDGPEMPIMDGSSGPFVEAIEQADIVRFSVPRRFIEILKPVRVEHGRGWAELLPYDKGFRLEVEIDFDTPLIGRQKKTLDLDARSFRRELYRARTFGFMKDVEHLWKAGYALGASLENTVALGDDRILNDGGLRYTNEFVRHKMLDAVGDLSLAGAPLLGHYRSYCGGHRMNVSILKALFADLDAYAMVELGHVHPVQGAFAGSAAMAMAAEV